MSRDLIDQLIDDLNDGTEGCGLIFERDALDTDRPEDWGAVELTGEDGSEYADGHLVDQVLTADVWVCLSGRGTKVKRAVQKTLTEFCDAHDGGWSLKSRAYLYDLDKVMWHWQVFLFGPLGDDEPDTEPEPEDEEDGEEGEGDG